jgi:hypothetical protein
LSYFINLKRRLKIKIELPIISNKGGFIMAVNKKQTSKSVASLAAKTLTDDNSSQIAKNLAGSALSQKSINRQTGSIMEDTASKVLKSNKYSDDTKTLAASTLSQSNKKR